MKEERKLTPQQQIFVNEYLEHFDFQKAIDQAGYTEDYVGMISCPAIQTALAEGIKNRIGKGIVSEEKVLSELGKIAFSSMADFISWSNSGVKIKDSRELSEDLAAVVQSINISPTGAMQIKLFDKKPALELLSRHFGMLKDKVEISGTVEHDHYNLGDYSKAELREEAAKIAKELEAVANVNGHRKGTSRINKSSKSN